MAARSPGQARGGSEGPRRTKTSTRAKTNPSTKTKSRKKKTKAGAASIWARLKPLLLGLGLGLVMGVSAAGLTFFWPQVKALFEPASNRPRPSPTVSPARPQAVHEDKQRWNGLIKSLDDVVFSTLGRLKIPDRDVNIVAVTPQHRGEFEWELTEIEVDLPAGLASQKVVEAISAALARAGLEPPAPKIRTSRLGQAWAAEIVTDGRHTHTLVLVAAKSQGGPSESIPAAIPEKSAAGQEKAASGNRPAQPPAPGGRARVALVIDDFGLSLDQARCFLEMDMPLAFSVLPFLPHSTDVARAAYQKGRLVMLHLPMQPDQWPEIDAGPGALLMDMDQTQVKARVREAFEAVPYAAGVNNHMGSRFTEDRQRMGWVMEAVKERGGFFLDSRTSLRSTAYDEARRLGLPAAKRAVFLDNIQEPRTIGLQIKKLIVLARQNGEAGAVGIGHVHPVTCQVLKSEYNYFTSKADLVPITALVR
ncbi:MAG: divergent polysaccharide deacetylase family protein [Thermodesulfobacteriota bacterium]